MTELQIGMIGLGVVAVAGVVVYNTWQEYAQRKLAKKLLESEHQDVLLAGSVPHAAETDGNRLEADCAEREFAESRFSPESPVEPRIQEAPPMPFVEERFERIERAERIEPVLRVEPEPEPEPDCPLAQEARKPGAEVASAIAPPPPAMQRVEESKEQKEQREHRDAVEAHYLLSPAIDYVAAFEAVEPAPAYQILESQRDVLAQVQKPVHWIGYNEFAREWEPIIDDGSSEYRRIRIGLQMADRRGPMGDKDLAVFHVAMQDLADELMAIAEMPPRQPALDGAAALDQFCAGVDIQIGINVISTGQVFPGTKLRALAEAAGMVIDAEGRFVRCDDEGNVLYVLVNQEASGFSVESMKTMNTHGVTFLLDVPRVSHGERVFNQMVDLAKRFAEVLKGALVDDNRRPLSEGALEPIRRQVVQYQGQMAARNIPAGGPLAQRLFS